MGSREPKFVGLERRVIYLKLPMLHAEILTSTTRTYGSTTKVSLLFQHFFIRVNVVRLINTTAFKKY